MSSKASRGSVVSALSKKGKNDKKDSAKDEEQEPAVPPQLAWKIIDEPTTERWMSLSPNELSCELAKTLKFENCEVDLKEASQVDFFVAAIWFACDSKMTNEQCSAFFTILHTLLENLKEKHLSIDENIKELKEMMTGVGISRLTSLQCFTVELANTVLRYVTQNLLQQYHLYKFLFHETQEEQDNICEELHIDLPPLLESLNPAPLEEAVAEEFHSQYIAPPSPPLVKNENEGVKDNDSKEKVKVEFESQHEAFLLANIDQKDIKSMMQMVTHQTMSAYKAQIETKLHQREKDYTVKLDKITKAIKSQ